MALNVTTAPYLIEDLSSTPKVVQIISNALKRLVKGFQMEELNSLIKPCILIFDNETPLENIKSFIHKKIASGCNKILAIVLKSKFISKTTYLELFREGISDIYNWDLLRNAEEVIAARIERWLTVEQMINISKIKDKLIGSSERWLNVIREVVEVALFSTAAVLITGESGTGKELIANLIHELDTRSERGLFTLVDCSSIVPELSGSEFFGHEKGSFTNAISSREGAFALAHNGTLFLDEVGELPLNLQAELLRVIQEGTYKKVGSNIWKQTSFRLVSATNRNISHEVSSHRFRQDLYFRMTGWEIHLPPLRERLSDIPLLVNHFLRSTLKTEKYIEVDDKLMDYLIAREYPGNIRELKQVVNRLAMKFSGEGPITLGMLGKEELKFLNNGVTIGKEDNLYQGIHKSISSGINIKELKEMVSDIAIRIAIDKEDGNLQRAASILGLTDRSLQLWKSKNNGISRNESDEISSN